MFTRSILFYILLGFWTVFMGLLCLPFLILPSSFLRQPVLLWIAGIFVLLKYICKITHEIQGKEYIPSYAVLIASKHQSAFETFALFYYMRKAIFIHKKQLFLIPIFGQYLKKINMISINRSDGMSAMRKMLNQAKIKIAEGNSIIIFPEGTRKKPRDIPDYKTGFIGIYNATESEILPIAVNSGYYWPKHTFIKTPGKIIIKILKPIPAKLKKDDVLEKIKLVIEEATNEIS